MNADPNGSGSGTLRGATQLWSSCRSQTLGTKETPLSFSSPIFGGHDIFYVVQNVQNLVSFFSSSDHPEGVGINENSNPGITASTAVELAKMSCGGKNIFSQEENFSCLE
jgi:hypothetical protein